MKYQLLLMISFASLTLFLSCGQNFSSKNELKKQTDSLQNPRFNPKVIYGVDNRLDLFQVNNKSILDLEVGIAGLVRSNKISQNTDGNFRIEVKDYGRSRKLCPNEKFYSQKISTFCTGFLIDDETLVTAGHCVLSKDKCQDTFFVFGLSQYDKEKSINYNSIDKKSVYKCKDLVHTVAETLGGQDFAIIKLDRKVTDREPLRIRRYGQAAINTKTILIGKPTGLPTKVAAGGKITKHSRHQFQSNNDAYAGNSGSPVFNSRTGVVEGILVRGALDFEYNKNKSCTESHKCQNIKDGTICGGEFSQYISDILPYIDKSIRENIFENKKSTEIPDNNKNGIISKIDLSSNIINTQKVLIHLNINHSWTGDLKIHLISPNDEKLLLFNNNGEYGQDLRLTYGELPDEQEALKNMSTEQAKGSWSLHIVDEFSRDKGTLNSWAIEAQ